jgi:HK97 family phage major capsid protein
VLPLGLVTLIAHGLVVLTVPGKHIDVGLPTGRLGPVVADEVSEAPGIGDCSDVTKPGAHQSSHQTRGASTYASNEALDDSQPGLRQVLAADHERSMGLTLDLQFLQGSGTTPNLRGIRNFSGVTATPLATNGATPTLDDIADAIERLETDNAAAAAIFMHPRTWATYRTLVDSQLRYQLQPDPTGESRRQLFGVPVYVSSQISTTETVGTSEDCSWVGVVDMSQIVVARRNEITIEYSRDFRFDFDQTAIRTVSRWDIAPVNEEGIEIITGVRA